MPIYVSSGGSAKLFAAIGVTYPEGSICTCTKGDKVLTAKNTSGKWVFAIPETGEWTVKATLGDNSAEVKKNITAEKQFEEVELGYSLELIKNGVALVNYSTSTAKVSTESDGALRIAYDNSSWNGTGIWYVTINVTKYSIVHIDGYYSKFNYGNGVPTVNIASTYNGSAKASASLTLSRASHEIDLTSVSGDANGNAVLSIRSSAYNDDTKGWQSSPAYIYNLWLE